MRLFESILDANHRALRGDSKAGVRPSEHEAELPLIALSCIDSRLNPLLPEVLGIPEDQFIWLRNAGNIVTGPMSSTMRSLALACAIKGGRQIVVIGHSNCRVCGIGLTELIERFNALGIPRAAMPANVVDFFGIFSSERQNVVNAVNIIRSSPLIGPGVPVHGLLVALDTGRLDWLVNGYQQVALMPPGPVSIGAGPSAFKPLGDFGAGDPSWPLGEIREIPAVPLVLAPEPLDAPPPVPQEHPPTPPRIPGAPPIRARLSVRRNRP